MAEKAIHDLPMAEKSRLARSLQKEVDKHDRRTYFFILLLPLFFPHMLTNIAACNLVNIVTFSMLLGRATTGAKNIFGDMGL